MTGPSPARLSAQVTAFAARLRARHGFLVGPGEVVDALRAVGAVNVLDVAEVRDALRAVLTASEEQGRVFDTEFDAFFRRSANLPLPGLPSPPAPRNTPGQAHAPQQEGKPGRVPGRQAEATEEEQATPEPSGDRALEQSGGAPDAPDGQPPLLRARFSSQPGSGGPSHVGAEDLPELLRAAGALVRAVELGRARRLRPQARGLKLDARRTLRSAARTAGDVALLKWLGRPRRTARFLLLLDGSRSMGTSAELLLHFAHALHLRARRVEVYAFSTALTRLTPYLRQAHPGEPLRLPDLGGAWGGGTRIGENLLRLAREERDRVNRDTVVLILSDGLDTGEPDVLVRALRDLKARVGLLVWLSPLAGTPGYQPVQRAVQAALPHLDAFLPAASVADLHALARKLRGG